MIPKCTSLNYEPSSEQVYVNLDSVAGFEASTSIDDELGDRGDSEEKERR